MAVHHVTGINGDPQRTLDFYTGALGLRLVKLTVNFDDPGTYHLYFGDELGRPGSMLTFFSWPGGPAGRRGTGQVGAVALAIPPAALGLWIARLLSHGIRYEGPVRRFDEQVVAFADPDGLPLELVASPVAGGAPWREGPLPPDLAIQGLHGVTIWEDGDTGTAALLVETLGFRRAGEEGNRLRFVGGSGGPGEVVELRRTPGFWQGGDGVGTVHHVAFRAADDEVQITRRREIELRGLNVTPVVDRTYFRSVYFREPGGVLFEIATDGPGFTVDETVEGLGGGLRLPAQYQAMREWIESRLPTLRLPQPVTRAG